MNILSISLCHIYYYFLRVDSYSDRIEVMIFFKTLVDTHSNHLSRKEKSNVDRHPQSTRRSSLPSLSFMPESLTPRPHPDGSPICLPSPDLFQTHTTCWLLPVSLSKAPWRERQWLVPDLVFPGHAAAVWPRHFGGYLSHLPLSRAPLPLPHLKAYFRYTDLHLIVLSGLPCHMSPSFSFIVLPESSSCSQDVSGYFYSWPETL